MTDTEPRPDDLGIEQPDTRDAEQLGGLGAERPDGLNAERPDVLPAEQPGTRNAEQPGSTSTEQIARAGTGTAAPAETTEQAVARSPQGDEKTRAQLLEPNELESMVNRWREIQASFVDDPRNAVKNADALVAELMQELARMFASQREQLESSWSAGDSVSTEDLRQGLQRYRSFFERLLAA